MSKLWEELDELNSEVTSRLGELNLPISSTVTFIRPYKNIKAGTRALVLDRDEEYYALTVKGNYIEGIHVSFLKELK